MIKEEKYRDRKIWAEGIVKGNINTIKEEVWYETIGDWRCGGRNESRGKI